MPDITNSDRAAWAAEAIESFRAVCGSSDDDQSDAKDLVTDIYHHLRLNVGLSGEEARSVMEAAIAMAEVEEVEDEEE